MVRASDGPCDARRGARRARRGVRSVREAAERWDEYGSIVERAYALLGLGRCGDAKALREGEAIFERLGASPVVAQAA